MPGEGSSLRLGAACKAVSRYENIGRQGSVERDPAMRQPRRSGAAHGRAGTAKEQFSAGRVSPQAVRAHGPPPKAITATAHKLVRLVYFMLTRGQACTCTDADAGQRYDEDRYRERVVQNLNKRAHTLGFQLVPAVAPA